MGLDRWVEIHDAGLLDQVDGLFGRIELLVIDELDRVAVLLAVSHAFGSFRGGGPDREIGGASPDNRTTTDAEDSLRPQTAP
jgi:hypothetical protein